MNKIRDKKLLLSFGDHLRLLRKKNDLTIEALAIEADVEISQIYRIEKGLVNPTLSTLSNLAKALNTTLPELMNF